MKQLLNKSWPLALGLIFLLVALVGTKVLVKNHLDQETGGDIFSQLVDPLQFDFVPKHDFLNIVVVRLKNPGLVNTSPYEMQILDGNNLLVSQKFSGANVGDPSDLRIQFPPLAHSLGKHLTIRLIPMAKTNDPLKVNISANGQLSFQAFYQASQFPNFYRTTIKDLRFLTIWGGTIAILMLFL